MAKSRTLKQGVFIQAPPDKVFRALIEPRLLRRWFVQSAALSPRTGGNYTFTWHGGYKHAGKVMNYAKDKTLSLSWPAVLNGKLLGTTRATFRVKPKSNGTILELTHSGFKSGTQWVDFYGAVCSGWAYFLTNLKSVLQHGRDLRSSLDRI